MEKYRASLQFKDYIVHKAIYVLNPNFELKSDKISIDYDIHATIEYDDDDNYVVLSAQVGDIEDASSPFYCEVEIRGIFGYDGNDESRESFFKVNATAVLFPYVRSLVSDLTSRSNLFPTYHLPLINIAKYINDKKNIEIIDGRDSSDIAPNK
ncbi:protein-export chaperone SecB [uncultured Abiotrophia sp.]|jgi:preprotein translocase subunit secB|uniref:protein-export chaperone SecB n=1 Tax=uncultured Abiotrophia sp. TaxID=316094 RepID=UPI002889644F|nr:protein-export chaperone SecB [uncultured Abiotrophia sp.]